MSTTLHYELKDAIECLGKERRWNVLTVLMLHTNRRNRCWIGMDALAKLATNNNLTKATSAKKWLIDHHVCILVPFSKRMEEECDLPPRQHVYELTGEIVPCGKADCDCSGIGKMIRYLYANSPNVIPIENFNVPTTKNLNGGNGSISNISNKDSSASEKDADAPQPVQNPTSTSEPQPETDSFQEKKAEQGDDPSSGQVASETSESPATGQKGSAKTKKKEGSIPAGQMNPMKEVIRELFYTNGKAPTDNEWGIISKASKQLIQAGYSTDDARRIYQYCKSTYEHFSPMALTTNAAAATAKPVSSGNSWWGVKAHGVS